MYKRVALSDIKEDKVMVYEDGMVTIQLFVVLHSVHFILKTSLFGESVPINTAQSQVHTGFSGSLQ